jgi:pyridoxal phosphate enzyme (YggS family)
LTEPNDLLPKLQHNMETVNTRIADACARSNRSPDDVRLIAVTKYAEWDWVCTLSQFHRDFGENRPQQLVEREPQLPDANWHLIGQLQTNKCRSAVRHACMIHSVDSLKLLNRIGRVAAEDDCSIPVLLQVNISAEESKSGFAAADLIRNWPEIVRHAGSHITLAGLMTMAPLSESAEVTRPVFRGLSELRDQLNDSLPIPTLTELSMGMSGDFEVAIEEGATMIRVGSSLFEGLSK